MTNSAKVDQSVSLPYLTDEQRWAAVVSRDPGADDQFFYSVATTGVYCRPSCGSRQPRRENVEFHLTTEAAEKAGFRPCKRCRPTTLDVVAQRVSAIEEACRTLEAAQQPPDLNQIAGAARMSRFHFQRVFKEITGVAPRAYFAECRRKRVQAELERAKTVTEAIYGAGFNSNGRFYARSNQILGMTPKAFRAGGGDASIRFAVGECSLGSILVAETSNGVCSILLGDDPDRLTQILQKRFPAAELVGGDREFEQRMATVVGFIDHPAQGLKLALDVQGTAFQQRVWRALSDIPAGSTASYEDIARRIGAPKSVRAVAAACASNSIAVAIPCHRVVRKDGGLSGYRWGVERKRTLLEREASA
jgi:AraC family transcriptional regulator, regulatory protein of adaptative response / methylated-DNA-[protein]-cysteine methyltransferase